MTKLYALHDSIVLAKIYDGKFCFGMSSEQVCVKVWCFYSYSYVKEQHK